MGHYEPYEYYAPSYIEEVVENIPLGLIDLISNFFRSRFGYPVLIKKWVIRKHTVSPGCGDYYHQQGNSTMETKGPYYEYSDR